MTLDSFQSAGVYSRAIHAFQVITICSRNKFGMKGKMIGLIPSGPGDFFALKPVNAGLFRKYYLIYPYPIKKGPF